MTADLFALRSQIAARIGVPLREMVPGDHPPVSHMSVRDLQDLLGRVWRGHIGEQPTVTTFLIKEMLEGATVVRALQGGGILSVEKTTNGLLEETLAYCNEMRGLVEEHSVDQEQLPWYTADEPVDLLTSFSDEVGVDEIAGWIATQTLSPLARSLALALSTADSEPLLRRTERLDEFDIESDYDFGNVDEVLTAAAAADGLDELVEYTTFTPHGLRERGEFEAMHPVTREVLESIWPGPAIPLLSWRLGHRARLAQLRRAQVGFRIRLDRALDESIPCGIPAAVRTRSPHETTPHDRVGKPAEAESEVAEEQMEEY
jgi:hypothetical protein